MVVPVPESDEEKTGVKGVLLNWNILTMIISVVSISYFLFSWFDAKFVEFEERLDKKYATRERAASRSLRQSVMTIVELQSNLEEFQKYMIKDGADDESINSIRKRIRALRALHEKFIQDLIQDQEKNKS